MNKHAFFRNDAQSPQSVEILGLYKKKILRLACFAIVLIASILAYTTQVLADDVPALTTPWQYYGFDGSTYELCAGSDSDAANQTIAATYTAACTANFNSWTTGWPNTVGVTDYYRYCPPVGVPYQWGMQHREARNFNIAYTTHSGSACTSPPSLGASTVQRQFWYYCADPNYTLVTYSPSTIPICQRTVSTTLSPAKQPKCDNCSVGNPINLVTGQKYQRERDYQSAATFPLLWERHYSAGTWTTAYSRNFIVSQWAPATGARTIPYYLLQVIRDDGQVLSFNNNAGAGSAWAGDPDVILRVTTQFDGSGNVLGHTLIDENDAVETYNASGHLVSVKTRAGVTQTIGYNTSGQMTGVTDPFGHALSINYYASGQISNMKDPNGGTYQYSYDASGNLSTVTYPDLTVRTYLYNEIANTSGTNLPHALTGIIDETTARYATYQYDTTGRGISTQHAGGAELTRITYNADGSATVTDALGAVRTYTFKVAQNVGHVATLTGPPCNNCGLAASSTYDTAGNLSTSTDFNGVETSYSISSDGRNLVTQRTEGAGTGTFRSTQTQWSTTFRLPTQIVLYTFNQTNFGYDASGNMLTRTVTDPTSGTTRTWTYTYDSYGRVLTADGPRTDVGDTTTYAYYTCTTGYQCGQLQTITDALGHITTFNTYNAHGQPLTITDPNGVVTTLTYDLRQRLTSRQIGSETTSYSYYPTGLLHVVTLPDTSTITYSYDAAHRLTDITDGLGNHIHYTLDAMGNRTAENTYDPSSTLKRTHTRVINTLNELYQDVNAAGTAVVTTTLGYDNNGNLTSSNAPLSRNTANQYDFLNRLTQTTDPSGGVTQFAYDVNDDLTSVRDPRFLTTSYMRNGFGDVKTTISPDTGTSLTTYDSGGNLKTTTDARGAIATYAYDALNRPTQVAYTDQTINFSYDAGTNGVGRLTGASDTNYSMSWTYNGLGRVTGKGQTIGTVTKSVGYSYTNGDQTSLVTPSGQTVTYGYTNHRITSITVNGTIILSGATYDPFGPANAWTWGNATTTSRTFDQDGNPSQIITAGVTNGYTIDNAWRITGISDSGLAANSWTFGYDLLDRVNAGTSTAATRGYTYDANSNRLTTTGTTASTETISGSNNHLNSTSGGIVRSYAYDNDGNTLSYTGETFTFNQRGRMSSAIGSAGTTNYVYNALGQLIEKSGNGGTTLLVHDEAGHILGEYTASGALIQETVWMDDTPIATLRPNGAGISIYYVHTDHLGTPRKVTRPSDNGMMWRWDPDTFGSVSPNTNPAGLGAFNYNLRFPGQYALNESGIYYNFFRDYDPNMGRYIESDPIGLGSGVNTYAYGNGNPITNADPTGLRPPTPAEAQFIQQYFGPCINPQKLDIKVRKWGDTSRALSLGGGFMSFPSSYFLGGSGNNSLNLADSLVAGTLGHETLHQLQRLNGISVTGRALLLQMMYSLGLADPYQYNSSTDPAAMLLTFQNGNVEMQGQMFQDYVENVVTGMYAAPYSQIASQVKGKCSCRN